MTDEDKEALKTLNPQQALAVMNRLICISNDLHEANQAYGWFEMGRFVEALASKARLTVKE